MRRFLARGSPILGLFALTISCSPDQPTIVGVPANESQVQRPPHLIDEDALGIDEMLGDPVFQGSLAEISDEALLEPLVAAVDALARGQVARARGLIARARAEAEVLLDGPITSSLISWSTIERYFEEAELL
ncbi:MAG TPA: hypothetical protein VK858_01225 [Longimicrobiales bacterium]|nr:hypothetical protein [Longimicrobiales bacterium]